MADVIVVGGGVAGMTAAIYARASGLSCCIFEKEPHLGGALVGWRRHGCVIDNCMHWLNGTHPGDKLHRVWLKTGMLEENTPVHRGHSLYESRMGGERIALSASPERTRRDMLALSPEDAPEINRLIRTVLALEPFMTGGDLLQKSDILHVLPDIWYYWKHDLFTVASHFKHPLLRLCLTDYIGGEFSAMALLCAYAAFTSGDGSLPAGGSPAAAERMASRCRAVGCEIHTGEEVVQFVRHGDRIQGVLTKKGDFYPASYVIAACDPEITFGRLLPAAWMPRGICKMLHSPQKSPLFSSIHAAFVCDRGAISPFGTTVIEAPYFSRRSGGRMIVREFSQEGHFAPLDRTVLQCMVFQTEDECAAWIALAREPAAYAAHKKEITARMMDALTREMPALQASLVPIDFWTPATYRRYLGNRTGAYLTGALTPRASLKHVPNTISALCNFALATQWLHAPGGLPNAAMAGKTAAERAGRFLKVESGKWKVESGKWKVKSEKWKVESGK